MLIERAELGQVLMGLFEMVAEDFLELGRAIDGAIGFVRPGDEPLVKLGARSLEESRIGRIANHQVSEAVLEGFFLRRSLVSHELPLLERHQVNWDFAPNLVVDDGLERCLDKDQADHRGRVDNCALVFGKLVEARCQQRVDRRRDRNPAQVAGRFPPPIDGAKHAGVDEHRHELLDKERVALGGRDHPGACAGGKPGLTEHIFDEPGRVGIRETGQDDAARAGCFRPGGLLVEEHMARRAKEHYRRILGRGDQTPDQVQKGLFRPVNVVEQDSKRPVLGEELEEAADAPEELRDLKRGIEQADGRGHPVGDLIIADEPAEFLASRLRVVRLLDAGRIANHPDDGPERDALAVRETAAADHANAISDGIEELLRETGFAHAGITDQGDHATGPIGHCGLERAGEERHLRFAPDHRLVLPPARRRDRPCGQEPVGTDRLRLALER